MRCPVRLLVVLLVGSAAAAQPLFHQQGGPGRHYELKASCLSEQQSWLGGRLKTDSPTGWEDGFLTCLNGQGQIKWEKVFGSREGGESVEQLAADAQGGVYAAGQAACDLGQAWSGSAAVDWQHNAYLAHVDGQGSLLKYLDLRVQADDPNREPFLRSGALCRLTDQVYLGLSLQGRLADIQSGPEPLGVVLVGDAQLNSIHYYKAPAQDVQALALIQGRLYGAGRTQIREGLQMGPPVSRPVLWDMTDPAQPRLLWTGEAAENVEIQQLSADGMVWTRNGSRTSLRLDLQSLQVESLPPGLLRLAGRLGLGYVNGKLEGTQSLGDCDLVLWRREQEKWSPWARLGTSERDFPGELMAVPDGYVASASLCGRLPGQPAVRPGSQNWLWFRFGQETSLAPLGQRQPGELLAQLGRRLQNVVFQEQPDYQHLVGFLQGQVISTTPGVGFDNWLRHSLDGQLQQQWSPARPQQAPMEPQIFPALSGQSLICLDPARRRTAWFRGEEHGYIEGVWARHCWESPQGIGYWLGIETNSKDQQRLRMGQLGSKTSVSVSDWGELLEPLALTGGPDGGPAAIWQQDNRLQVRCYSTQGRQLRRFALPGGQWRACLGLEDGLYLAGPDRLLRLNWKGKTLTSLPLPLKVRRIKKMGEQILLLGSRLDPATGVQQPAWMPATGGQLRSLPLDQDGYLQDAWEGPDGLWLGGEIVQDYVTDVFWGRLNP